MGSAVQYSKILLNICQRQKGCITKYSSYPQVFDRSVKCKQRNWAVGCKDYELCQYIKDEVGYQIADKVRDLNKFSEICISLGCDGGHFAKYLSKEKVGLLVQCDISEGLVRRSNVVPGSHIPILSLIAEEELVPFRLCCADLVVSNLNAHWINNISEWFSRCFSILREDCPMIGALLAGDTLQELRISLQLAESERLGGIGAHISPFLMPQDVGTLMTRAGFEMITLDSDRIEIGYPHIFALLYDLQSMGESNATRLRAHHLRRDILVAADTIYKAMFGGKDGAYPATFQVISFIGWRPGPKMPKPAKRGSQNVSFKDISKIASGEIPLPSSQ